MELNEFKKVLDPLLFEFLDTKINSLPKTGSIDIEKYFIHLLDFLKEGKRIRSYLAYTSYKFSGGAKEKEIINLLVFLELFHAFCLVHDDIMDQSDLRHGTKTIHKFITDLNSSNKEINPVHFGNSQAILIGDYLISWAFEVLITNKDFDIESIQKVQKIFFKMIDEVCLGQMLDMEITKEEKVTDEIIYQKILLKTAGYSFIKPLLIGESLTGETKNVAFFEEFGKYLGIAFQMQDDILDISESSKTHKKSFTDIEAHQHTLLTNYVFTNGTKEQKIILNRYFGKKIKEDDRLILKRLFEESGAIKHAEDVVEENLKKAKDLVENSSFNTKYKEILFNLLSLLENRQK
jgi:geranylgeranyl diphosphate synthase, type I